MTAQTSARRTHSGSPAGPARSALSLLAGGKHKEKIEPGPAAGCADDVLSYSSATFWQYADSGPYPRDQDLFNGDAAGLSQYVDSLYPRLPRISLRRAYDTFTHRVALGS